MECDVGREVVGQPAYQRRRLHLDGARCVQRASVEVDAQALDRGRLVADFVRLVDPVEGPGEVLQVADALLGAGGVCLAGPFPTTVDGVCLHGRLEVRLSGPVEADLAPLVLRRVAEALGPQVVGVVDGEAR